VLLSLSGAKDNCADWNAATSTDTVAKLLPPPCERLAVNDPVDASSEGAWIARAEYDSPEAENCARASDFRSWTADEEQEPQLGAQNRTSKAFTRDSAG
jgi:hypothetical protein